MKWRFIEYFTRVIVNNCIYYMVLSIWYIISVNSVNLYCISKGENTQDTHVKALKYTWHLWFSCIFTGVASSEPCSFMVIGSSGAINLSSSFVIENTCIWHIEVPRHHNIRLNFTTLNIVNQPGSNISSVKVYDGRNESQTLLGYFTENKSHFSIQSSGRYMLVVATGVASFKAVYTSRAGRGNSKNNSSLISQLYWERIIFIMVIPLNSNLKAFLFTAEPTKSKCWASHRFVSTEEYYSARWTRKFDWDMKNKLWWHIQIWEIRFPMKLVDYWHRWIKVLDLWLETL